MKSTKILAIMGCSLFLTSMAASAFAAEVRLKCERRGNRSRATVNAKDLTPGSYTVNLSSNGNTATGTASIPLGQDSFGLDFDSGTEAGAVHIARDFIGSQATAEVVGVGTQTATCRVRSR